MLTRWHLLLGSTILLGALLLVGCGGHNNMGPTISPEQPSLVSRQANQPPGNLQLRIGMLLSGEKYVGVRAVDPDGDRIQYKVTIVGPVTLTFDQTQGAPWYSFSWSKQPVADFASGRWGFVRFPAPPSGSYTIHAQAYDGKDWSSNKSLSITF